MCGYYAVNTETLPRYAISVERLEGNRYNDPMIYSWKDEDCNERELTLTREPRHLIEKLRAYPVEAHPRSSVGRLLQALSFRLPIQKFKVEDKATGRTSSIWVLMTSMTVTSPPPIRTYYGED